MGVSDRGGPQKFIGTDFTGALFRDVDLTNATITGLIDGLVVNDIEIAPLIVAELDRRHPERALFRSEDPADLARAWQIVRDQLLVTFDHVRELTGDRLNLQVNEEWSALESLRHLVFVADDWYGRTVRDETMPYWSGGLMPSFLNHPERVGIDESADPDLDQVLGVFQKRMAQLDASFSNLTADELLRSCSGSYSAGTSQPVSVRTCLQALLEEFAAHRRYVERDLALSA